MRLSGGPERLPHIHHRQPDALGFPRSQGRVELFHAGFRPVVATEPDRSLADQVADHDAVGVALADRDLVDADHLGSRQPGTPHLLGHVLLVQGLDRLPVELELLGDVADGRLPATPSDVPGKALGVERIVGEEVEPLGLHLAASPTVDPANLQFQPDAGVATGQVAHAANLAVVPPELRTATAAADRFFPRRTSVMTRALGSPNTPLTWACGRKPGNRYASSRRRRLARDLAMTKACQKSERRR